MSPKVTAIFSIEPDARLFSLISPYKYPLYPRRRLTISLIQGLSGIPQSFRLRSDIDVSDMPSENHAVVSEGTGLVQDHRPVTPHLDQSSAAESLPIDDSEEEQNVNGDDERIEASAERVFSGESPKSYVCLTHIWTG